MTEIIPATRFDQTPDLELRYPPMPTTVAEVSSLLASHEDVPDTHRLVEIVNHDPVIAASVLRRINSAYYGMRRLISDVRKAVFLLGFLEVSNIVLTAAMLRLKDALPSKEQEEIFTRVMRVSVCAAYFSHEMGVFANVSRQPSLFSAGLLHSIGRLVLLYNKPHDYEALWWTREDGIAPAPDDERLIFGTDHTQLGSLAAEKWNFPEQIVELIGNYHAPERLRDSNLRVLGRTLALGVSAAERTCLSRPSPPAEAADPRLILLFSQAVKIPPAAVTEKLEDVRGQSRAVLGALLDD